MAQADSSGTLKIDNLPPGDYEAHLWVEGVDPRQLDQWTHRVRLIDGPQSLGSMAVDPNALPLGHTNKFGEPYLPELQPY